MLSSGLRSPAMSSCICAGRRLALYSCALLLSLHLPSGSAEEVCGPPGSEKCPRRQVQEKTPTPCLESYSEEHVQSAAEFHIEKVQGGHQVPHLLLLFGGSGAGKGTFIKHVTKHGFDRSQFAFHGLDEYLQYLAEFQHSVMDHTAVYKDAADACYSGGAIPIAKAAGNKIIARRLHTVYEETGKNLDRVLKRVIPAFEEAGYRITLVLVDNHVGIAQGRAEARFFKEGRYAPADYIAGTFKNVPENYKKLRDMGRVHEAVYCDNSCMGDGTKVEDALAMVGCLQCWRDVPAAEGELGDGSLLIPEPALLPGSPRYLDTSEQNVEL